MGEVEVVNVKVRSIINTNSLRPNSKELNALYRYCEEEAKDKNKLIHLHFNDVKVNSVCTDEKFKKLLLSPQFSNVFIHFYSAPSIYKLCNSMLMLAGARYTNKVTNTAPPEAVVPTMEDQFSLEANRGAKWAMRCLLDEGVEFDYSRNTIILHYYRHNGRQVLSIYNKTNDAAAIFNAVKQLFEENPDINVIEVDFGVLKALPDKSRVAADNLVLIGEYFGNLGKHVEYVFLDKESANNYEIAYGVYLSTKADKQKFIKRIRDEVEPLTVGLLAEYANTNKVDRLGRLGNGKVCQRQPAIFMGFDGDTLLFRVFKLGTFKRRSDWLNNRLVKASEALAIGETYDEDDELDLRYSDIRCSIDDVGVGRVNYGRKYHFSLPVLTRGGNEEFETVLAYRKRDKNWQYVSIVLPRFLYLVLSENPHIKFNHNSLDVCIGLTEANMRKLGIKLINAAQYDFYKAYNGEEIVKATD